MGRYIGWNDIVGRYPGVSARGGSTEINTSYISAVEAQIDGYLAPCYSTPFSSNNITVKDLAIELCYAGIGNHKYEDAKLIREEVFMRMDRLKLGSEQMITADGTAIASNIDGTMFSTTEDYHPVFGMSPLEYSQVDSSAVYAEEADRGNV